MTSADTIAAAFTAGLVTSLHCAGMCGPLSCSWAIASRKDSFAFFRDTGVYHASRMTSYGLVGAAAGALGVVPLRFFQHGAGVVLPWMIVVAFAAVGVGLDHWIPKPKILLSAVRAIQTRAFRLKSAARASLLGLGTPLLPCGPLYLMFGLAMASGSAIKGGGFGVAFALGTLPLLLLAQTQLHWLGGRLSPQNMRRVQRVLALGAAGLLAWRLRDTLGGGNLPPSCCHAAL